MIGPDQLVLIGCCGIGDNSLASVSKRAPFTRISLNAGGLPRNRLESVPAPIIRIVQPSRSIGRSNGWWTCPVSTACAPARANAARIAARLSDARYRAGVDSFLTSLDAQRTAYAAQQQLVTTRFSRGGNLVELYRALGGGLR